MDLMTLDEVAAALRVPVATIRYWRAQGRGPEFIRLGRRIVCRRADLERFVEQQYATQSA
jgi:excisionase family DNA binding protein